MAEAKKADKGEKPADAAGKPAAKPAAKPAGKPAAGAGGKAAGGKAAEKVGKKSTKWKLYKTEGSKISRISKFCPKCGDGVFMASHKDRNACGKCGYTEFKVKASKNPSVR